MAKRQNQSSGQQGLPSSAVDTATCMQTSADTMQTPRSCRGLFFFGLMVLAAIFIVDGVLGSAVNAQVRVRKAADVASPIDVSGLQVTSDRAGQVFRETLTANLERFGWFNLVSPSEAAFRIMGEQRIEASSVRVTIELVRPATRETVLRRSYSGEMTEAARLAHRVHDDIVKAITGRPGIAATSLLLIGDRDGAKEMYWLDADGTNLRRITRDRSISVSPAWAPDARSFVYTSYKRGFPDVYLVNLIAGSRERIAAFPGLNTSAAISPDGREMALILSKDGNPELYVMDLRRRRLTRLTRTAHANEASPSWSPDGRRIVYVSDTTGTPHLYIVDRSGEGFRRLTTRGRDNGSPDWGPDGRIVYSSRRGPYYQLVLLDPDTGEEHVLTDASAHHEDPSWAPDGRHIAYTRRIGGHSAIYRLDTIGGESVSLLDAEGRWHSPAWSPR